MNAFIPTINDFIINTHLCNSTARNLYLCAYRIAYKTVRYKSMSLDYACIYVPLQRFYELSVERCYHSHIVCLKYSANIDKHELRAFGTA